ncbi:hypothetical protein [Mycobacterium persicum]|uniref:hypothetical protein n=1 Tax=Mycobacterium persicum TaxID=1487726 RepID=UPI001604B3F8|nr:hypothetical protein [Mycobacterium persicum]
MASATEVADPGARPNFPRPGGLEPSKVQIALSAMGLNYRGAEARIATVAVEVGGLR